MTYPTRCWHCRDLLTETESVIGTICLPCQIAAAVGDAMMKGEL